MTQHPSAHAVVERITGIASMATRHLLAQLAADFERRSGRPVAFESVGGVDAARRVEAGEAFDVVVLASPAIEKLAAAGRIDARSRVDLVRSFVALAVRTGTRRPAVDSEQSVRDALLAAGSIGCSTGPSGRHLARLFERWGVADVMARKIVEAPPGVPVGGLVARGEVEIGVQQLSELMHVPGIDVAGTLPPGIQEVTVFAGAVCATSSRSAIAGDFLAFCASPDADAAKRAHGLGP